MIQHYLKIAFRNLLKYKTQSIISIVGLAMGFTCFALSLIWVRYEMTYDDFHKDADRIYTIYHPEEQRFKQDGIYVKSVKFTGPLELTFPEVEASCITNPIRYCKVQVEEGQEFLVPGLLVDPGFVSMFNIRVLDGAMDFWDSDDKVAITEETALKLFGTTEHVIGKKLTAHGKECTVAALVQGWGVHTNLEFGFLESIRKDGQINWIAGRVWFKLREGVDAEAFCAKLYENAVRSGEIGDKFNKPAPMPITQYHYKPRTTSLAIKFEYQVLFCITGGLVIFCALLNYLSLFVSRLWMRVREMVLRKVCGSSGKRLYTLFLVEFMLVLSLAFLLGMVFIELSLSSFREITGVTGNIYISSFLYFVGVSLFAFLAFLWVLSYFNRHTLQQMLKSGVTKTNRHMFNKGSLLLQMLISILFIFCAGIIIKQLYYLRNGDIGLERKGIACLQFNGADSTPVAERLKQIPSITEVLENGEFLTLRTIYMSSKIIDWEGKQSTDEEIKVDVIGKGDALMRFYKFRLLKGRTFDDAADESHSMLITETAARTLGWSDPIGKTFAIGENERYIVIGLVKDIYLESPTVPAGAIVIRTDAPGLFMLNRSSVLVKYQDVQWPVLKDEIKEMLTDHFPGVKGMLIDFEENFEKYLRSENLLLKLLSVEAVVCILISIFGIYSFVTLTCELRRKEIAIRKVNGARVGDILLIFLKEYMTLLLIASAIAFPFGYVLMKKWIEAYTRQTPISAWVFLVIFAGVALIILLSIASRVWVAARQNPAEVIKSE